MRSAWIFARSSYCNGSCECVEVASDSTGRQGAIRDSKNRATVVIFNGDAWQDFLDHIKAIGAGSC